MYLCVAFITILVSCYLLLFLYSNKEERLQPIVVGLNNKSINQPVSCPAGLALMSKQDLQVARGRLGTRTLFAH